MDKTIITGKKYSEERPLFGEKNLHVENCTFDTGESPLKEVSDVEVIGGAFHWKYPLWYARNVKVKGTYFDENARAGIWYTEDIAVEDCQIDAPKEFRRCRNLKLTNVRIPNAAETLWWNLDVSLNNVEVSGDYFAMGTENIKISGLTLYGNYSFDGCKNIEIDNSRLYSKDCVWNAENVTIRDSYIEGEYLAWNSKNVTLINCTIRSLQGLCYVDGLKLINCKLMGTSLAFEYSTVDARVTDCIDSVMNPLSGKIVAPRIDKLIMDESKVDVNKTEIIAKVGERLDEFDGVIPEE